MEHGDTLLRFDQVSFSYDHKKPILTQASFSVRENAKLTIIGQNGAGKSTIFKLITGDLKPQEGQIHIKKGATIGIAKQVIPTRDLEYTVEEFFATAFREKKHDLERHIKRVLDVVNLPVKHDRKLKDLSGGQKARLLLAYAIITEPDILLLDEPTNNLDDIGIGHLTGFLISYEKTCIVISHDSAFLNCFTHGVINLDAFTHTTQQYVGDYYDVVAEIEAQIEAEKQQNARMEKSIQDRKDKINFFAHKGGKMRKLASKMRDDVAEAEENMVDVRQEDKTIPPFTIDAAEYSSGPLVKISSVTVMKDHKPTKKKLDFTVRRRHKVLIKGPNGIGKTTLLESMVSGKEKGVSIAPEVKVGYYRQDFSGLPMDKTVYEVLAAAMDPANHQQIFSTAARFLLPGDKVQTKVEGLSEGQKGLLCFARFMLQKPTLLILDEPSNHINFRHLPVIADALNDFEGGIILITHDQAFLDRITIDDTIDLGSL
jgi:ATP-binding cassette, subfamily F, member 3